VDDASVAAMNVVGWIGGLSWLQIGCLLIAITISLGLIQLLLDSFWRRNGGWPPIHIWVSKDDDNTTLDKVDSIRATTEDTLLVIAVKTLQFASIQDIVASACSEFNGGSDLFHYRIASKTKINLIYPNCEKNVEIVGPTSCVVVLLNN